MEKDFIIRKITSRKLWVSIASFVAMLMAYLGADKGSAEAISALILAFASCLGYLLSEGLVDSNRVDTNTEKKDESEGE